MPFRTPLTFLLLTMASACRVGPDHVAPTPEVPERFDAASEGAGEDAIVHAWWETFDDPALRACVEAALAANHDVRSSLQRIRAARALRGAESSGYWPTLGARSSYLRDRISENDPRFGPAVDQGLFDRDVGAWELGFDAAWELDLFGAVYRRTEAATAELEEQELERGARMLSVAAEVARHYFELRGQEARLAVLDEQIANERARRAILDRRRQGGILTADPVLASRATEEALQATASQLEAEVRAGEYRLAVLLGRPPTDGVPELDRSRGLPAAQGHVPTGLPSELLRRRPDVLAAERRIAAASAEIGVATAELFPRFHLTGSPFLRAGDFGELFRATSTGWVFGPSVSWSLFSAGRNRARLEAARADHERALCDYEATVHRVLEEVESSLVRYGRGVETLASLAEVAELEARRTTIESQRDAAGIGSRLAVLDRRARALDADRLRIDQHVDVLVRLVGLHKALGGGWAEAEAIARADEASSAGADS